MKQPHTVKRYRPTNGRDAASNQTSLSFVGVSPTNEKCFLQSRAARAVYKSGGAEFDSAAVLYAEKGGWKINDLVVQAVPGFDPTYMFIVVGEEPKHDMKGTFRHQRVELARTLSIPRPSGA